MNLIHSPTDIKPGYTCGPVIARLRRLISFFQQQEADIMIAGCREIDLALQSQSMLLPVIDSLDLMAKAAIRLAGTQPSKAFIHSAADDSSPYPDLMAEESHAIFRFFYCIDGLLPACHTVLIRD